MTNFTEIARLERLHGKPIREIREEQRRERARGEAHFFTTMARSQIRAIRERREAGRPEVAAMLAKDLRLYLSERRRFRDVASGRTT